jgi:membrane protein DedA with SNARE-associated domain
VARSCPQLHEAWRVGIYGRLDRPVSGHEINQLIQSYGCGVVFLAAALQAMGAPVPGTSVLVAAAVYAATAHGLPIVGVILAGAGGAAVGTTAGYLIGRRGGAPLLLWIGRRLRQSPVRVHRLRAEFARRGAGWIFLGRFVTGIRNVTGLLAGASGMPFVSFLAVNLAAALAWATVNALEYYWFGRALAGASTWLQVLLVLLGLAWLALSLHLLRRHAARRLRGGEWAAETPQG